MTKAELVALFNEKERLSILYEELRRQPKAGMCIEDRIDLDLWTNDALTKTVNADLAYDNALREFNKEASAAPLGEHPW